MKEVIHQVTKASHDCKLTQEHKLWMQSWLQLAVPVQMSAAVGRIAAIDITCGCAD